MPTMRPETPWTKLDDPTLGLFLVMGDRTACFAGPGETEDRDRANLHLAANAPRLARALTAVAVDRHSIRCDEPWFTCTDDVCTRVRRVLDEVMDFASNRPIGVAP